MEKIEFEKEDAEEEDIKGGEYQGDDERDYAWVTSHNTCREAQILRLAKNLPTREKLKGWKLKGIVREINEFGEMSELQLDQYIDAICERLGVE